MRGIAEAGGNNTADVRPRQLVARGARSRLISYKGGTPQRVYPARILGLGLGFCCVAGVLLERSVSPWLWVALVAHGFLWPHFAYWWSRRSPRPRRAEFVNQMLDSLGGSFWVPVMDFSLLPSVLLLSMLSLNCITMGGARLLGCGFIAQLAGVVLGGLVVGFEFALEPTMRELIYCLPLLTLYPLIIGGITYRLAQRLDHDKRLLLNLSRIDPLTGLWNRAYWCERAEIEFARCQRRGLRAAMVLADIDHFKRINDRYGHGAGDEVLEKIASLLQPELRSGDLLCRYGGEEFALVLPDTDSAGAVAIVERLRGQIANADFAPAFPERLTMSFGVAEWSAKMVDTPAWIDAADTALYEVKRAGRNQVLVYQSAEERKRGAARKSSQPLPEQSGY